MRPFDAIVLAGGAARRLGGADKPLERVRGMTLLEHVLAAVGQAGRRIVVGPRRRIDARPPLIWVREEPPGSGPACAIAVGAQQARAGIVLILAADMPFIAPAIPALIDALSADARADAALLRSGGRDGYLAAAWRRAALASSLSAQPPSPGASARSLYRDRRIAAVEDAGGWGRDCDTWEDLALARRGDLALARREDLAMARGDGSGAAREEIAP